MKTLARIAILVLAALFISSCNFNATFGPGEMGNGELTQESRKANETFTEVVASEGIDVYLTQAATQEITVEADENIIDLIGTDIKDGRLRIHAIENIGRATKKVYVSLPEITALKSSSGADLIAKTPLEVDQLKLNASSGSDLELFQVQADGIEADASSGANIEIAGTANELDADSSSGANIKAKNLLTKNCTADASSGAGISVNVSESLVADANSGADIRYKGDPEVQKNKSVSGSIRSY